MAMLQDAMLHSALHFGVDEGTLCSHDPQGKSSLLYSAFDHCMMRYAGASEESSGPRVLEFDADKTRKSTIFSTFLKCFYFQCSTTNFKCAYD